MGEVKLTGPSMEQRIANRLRNSGGDGASTTVGHGSGPTRTFTNIHQTGRVANHCGDSQPQGNANDNRNHTGGGRK